MEEKPARSNRLLFAALVVLSALGVLVSLALLEKHANAHFGGGGDSGLCNALAIFSCDAAAKSAFSEVGGLPLAALGGAYYAALLVLLPLGRFAGRGFARVPDVVFGTSIGAVLLSLFLLGVSLLSLGKLCPLCMALYVIDLGLFAASWFFHPAGRKGAFRAALALPLRAEAWIFLGLMALCVFGAQRLYVGQAKAVRAESKLLRPDVETPIALDIADSPVRGPADAPITIVEFSDFQCPYCRLLKESLEEAAARHGGVRLVFQHYPLDEACNPNIKHKFHENACGAAKASVCAERQGKFWEMHDELFAHQAELTAEALPERASAIGLDAAAFKACLDDPATVERIHRDIDRAVAAKLEGTPTWYVNGVRYVGARKPEDLLEILGKYAPPKADQAR